MPGAEYPCPGSGPAPGGLSGGEAGLDGRVHRVEAPPRAIGVLLPRQFSHPEVGEHLDTGGFQVCRTGRQAQHIPENSIADNRIRLAFQQALSARFDHVSGKWKAVHMLQL